MRSYESLMAELDPAQREAATVRGNAVIAAGAGSGKTRVIAARYAHLVVERGLAPSQILTLTFTRKAAAEMYSRIHATLCGIDHPAAREALADFAFARIDTLDSFCNSVARAACRSYGVAPDFSIDNERAEDMADGLALSFLLERRGSAAIGQLMKRYSLAELPTRLFARTMVRHSPITRPLDLENDFSRQRDETLRRFDSELDSAYGAFAALASFGGGSAFLDKAADILRNLPERPDPNDRKAIADFLAFGDRLAKLTTPGNVKARALVEAKGVFTEYKSKTYPSLLSLAGFLLNEEVIRETFALLSDFQDVFARKKRETGILTFTDVSRMALDALVDDPDLRASYKSSIRSIMIDEFQDDNELQRDLLFLLAERPERRDKSVPRADELCADKLFFVGDEKQSIYRFRGADVSVFRSLARDLGSSGASPLATNYRSEPPLIAAFNGLFPRVFPDAERDGTDIPGYEASFEPIAARGTGGTGEGSPESSSRGDTPVEILLVNPADVPEDSPGALAPEETEAAAVADRIADLIASGFPVRDGTGTRPIAADDIAILFRTGRRQRLVESFLRDRGIPCQSETLKSLFDDAPVNDIYSLLRLAVFPADNTAYAVLLRSPLVGLGDEGFALAMIARLAGGGQPGTEPFGAAAAAAMGEADRAAFARGAALWRDIRARVDRVGAHELVTRVWYDEGYRYLVETDAKLAPYRELYDYFFELARRSDERGETLATFLDRIAELRESEERIDDLDIPVDRSGGVRLMTVHKSKGLEFPVVFLIDAAGQGRSEKNEEPVYISRAWGLSVNAGSPEGAEGACGNWCYAECRDEELSMARAELRRLLYVAMTRSEKKLVVTATLGKGIAVEDGDDAETALTPRATLELLSHKKDKRKGVREKSFLDLLLPALLEDTATGVAVSTVPPMTDAAPSRAESARARHSRTATRRDRPVGEANPFERIPLAEYPCGPRRRYSASSLAEELAEGDGADAGAFAGTSRGRAENRADREDPLNAALAEAGVSATEFGTLVHAYVEARFGGREPPRVPHSLAGAVAEMANRFLESRLGTLARSAPWRATEYAFLTEYRHEGRTIVVSGQVDLAFESGGTVYVVDYKTDRLEEPERHAPQLSIYRKALADLRGKPVETWLFYLRSGVATPIS